MFTLRDADFNGDREFARRVHHEAYREVVMKQFGEWNEELQDQFFEDGWSKGIVRQIVVIDGVDGGVVQRVIRKSREDELFLSELQLLPQFQRRGIGSVIIRQLQSEAKSRGLPLRLQVLRDNQAQRLYERLGFIVMGETDTVVKMEWRG